MIILMDQKLVKLYVGTRQQSHEFVITTALSTKK